MGHRNCLHPLLKLLLSCGSATVLRRSTVQTSQNQPILQDRPFCSIGIAASIASGELEPRDSATPFGPIALSSKPNAKVLGRASRPGHSPRTYAHFRLTQEAYAFEEGDPQTPHAIENQIPYSALTIDPFSSSDSVTNPKSTSSLAAASSTYALPPPRSLAPNSLDTPACAPFPPPSHSSGKHTPREPME